MEYRFAPAADHGDLDAVLASAPGRPTLPVRLTLELFGRARSHLGAGPVTVWDPCCGAGSTLAVLGLRRGSALSGLVGTDVDPSPLDLARRNLALLKPGGLDARASELDGLARRHGKAGYLDAATAARRLAAAGPPDAGAGPGPAPIPTEVGVADATDPEATLGVATRHRPRLVLADLPHGRQTEWAGSDGGPAADDAVVEMVSALSAVLDPDAVLALVGHGRRLPLPAGTRTLERFRVGHRAAVVLRAGDAVGPSGQ